MLNLRENVKILVARETPLTLFQLILLTGVIFSIFLPIRFDITGLFYYQTPYLTDFTRVFSFPGRILGVTLYLTYLVAIYRSKQFSPALLLIALLLGLFVFHHVVSPIDIMALELNSWFKLICALLVGYYVYKSETWLKYRDYFLWVFILLATFNAIVGLIQFFTLQSIGLSFLGESPLSIFGTEIAKSVANGTTFLRGYGLFPHPNVLAGVLVITSPFILYLLNKTEQRKFRMILYTCLGLIVLAVFITLSRAGIIALFLSTMVYAGLNWYQRIYNYRSEISVGIILIVSLFIFYSWLVPRATFLDHAVIERGILNESTLEIIKENWLFGTGAGTNPIALHAKLSSYLEPWLIQPVHNYFLILLSDLGIIGAGIIALILYVFFGIFRVSLSEYDHAPYSINWAITLCAIAVAIFTLFWFDHYFYTIMPAQMMLWICIGMMARKIKTASQKFAKSG